MVGGGTFPYHVLLDINLSNTTLRLVMDIMFNVIFSLLILTFNTRYTLPSGPILVSRTGDVG